MEKSLVGWLVLVWPALAGGAGPWLPGEGKGFGPSSLFLPASESGSSLKYEPHPGRRLLVVLDPGHGGEQKGAVGVGGFTEKDFALQMARELARELVKLPDMDVVLTRERDEDVSLWRRVEMANDLEADIFVSIHANALTRPEIGGVETFFHSLEATGQEARRVAGYENATASSSASGGDVLAFILQDIKQAERLRSSAQLASLVHKRLANALDWEDRGLMQADFIVLRGTTMPSILLELGFVTCARDVELLRKPESLSKIAAQVAAGIFEFRDILLRKRGRPVEGRGK